MALCNMRRWRTPLRRCGPATTAASWVSEVWPIAFGIEWSISDLSFNLLCTHFMGVARCCSDLQPHQPDLGVL